MIHTYTGIIIIAVVVGLVAWDIYARAVGGVASTISAVILSLSFRYPFIPFAAGLLCGHLFAPQGSPKP